MVFRIQESGFRMGIEAGKQETQENRNGHYRFEIL